MNNRHVSDARYAWKQQTPEQKAVFAGWLVEQGLAQALYDQGSRGRGGIVGEVTIYLPDTLPFSPADQREESKRLRGDFANEVTKFSEAVQVASKYLGTLGLPAIPSDRARVSKPVLGPAKTLRQREADHSEEAMWPT
jgi:hypothetical protein